ncbi:hypothetical protein NMG60_11024391 [Bertholletia excelsa]
MIRRGRCWYWDLLGFVFVPCGVTGFRGIGSSLSLSLSLRLSLHFLVGIFRFGGRDPRITIMATYYPTLSNQRDVLPSPYLRDPKLPSNLAVNPIYPNPLSTQTQLLDFIQVSPIGDSELLSRTTVPIAEDEHHLRPQGLSLSLQYPYVHPNTHVDTHPSISNFFSPHVQIEDNALSKVSRYSDYLSYNLPGRTQNVGSTSLNSNYLKAAQVLLDEVVSVQNALTQSGTDRKGDSDKSGVHGLKEIESKTESTTDCSSDISPSERQDLRDRVAKLSSLLDEVDRRYRQYHNEMKMMISSFEMVAGHGAGKPYTTLALQTISRQFRRLHDVITDQIRATQQRLGDQDEAGMLSSGQGQPLPRLRYVDQQLRQQRALQQFGVMRHSWRPQRGLPESSVTILRAWLFEHFLHPYPKDLEKLMLARQTGLTRSQVANWFINARVRLWKPMIEEMYKEEFGEVDSKSSPDRTVEEQSVKPEALDRGLSDQFNDPKPDDLIPEVGVQGCTARLGFRNGLSGANGPDCTAMNIKDDCRSNLVNPHHDGSGNSIGYNISEELGSFALGERVSLSLGLQNCETDAQSMSGVMQSRGEYVSSSPVGRILGDYDRDNQYFVA